MAKIKVNNVELYYEVHGEGEPLLCISGFTADHNSWTKVLAPLARKYRVIIFDNRGVGMSEAPNYPYTVEMMAEDTFALLEALDIPKTHIIGHSMGGMIAMSMATQRPEMINQLVLCHTIEKTTTSTRLAFDFVYKLMSIGMTMKEVFPMLVPLLFSNPYLDMPGNLEMIFELSRKNPNEMSFTGFKHQLNAIAAFDARAFINQIKASTLIIAGENDAVTPASYARIMKRMIAGAQLTVVPATGHMSQIEKPELFSELVLGFLK